MSWGLGPALHRDGDDPGHSSPDEDVDAGVHDGGERGVFLINKKDSRQDSEFHFLKASFDSRQGSRVPFLPPSNYQFE
jgi:hypothetical protein